ncbi:myosin light chain kinase 2, skeletal/cardiac muscle isoform B [Patagioenas fasciata monilis]|uniref:Myosin light chain kinase 2, skeletal/cardiac muscle n=1 Tax=Patagioenas fasciata monilis TaxID=372326 RepID=A0A1V4KKM0_PATFA|nr:myosin light chain kinase 2, skeletal/cardiac muscle isoform B [Patagioenas fasciata monilis]
MEGTVVAATGVQDEGKDKAGQQKAPAGAVARDGAQAEPGEAKPVGAAGGGKAESAGETTLTALEPRGGGTAAAGEEAPAVQHGGGTAASAEGKVLVATEVQDGGKDEPGKKGPAVGEPKGGQAEPVEGKGSAAGKAQDGGKDKPMKDQAPGGLKAEGGGKAEPAEALTAAQAEGEKAKPMEVTTLAAQQAQDGGKEEPAKEKTTAAVKGQDGGKKVIKAEKTPADKKPAKEKAPATVKAQNGENKVAKAEKAPAAKKAQDGGKEEPAKEKGPAPAKEKALGAAKAQDGEKAAAKAEKTPAAKKPQDGNKKELAKEKAPSAAKVQDRGKKTAKAEKNPVTSKVENESKEEPAKEETVAAAKEKVPAPVKAHDGEKEVEKVETPIATAATRAGGKKPVGAAATAAVKAQGEGDKVAKVVRMQEQQQVRASEPPRPALLQSLSCPAACQREEPPSLEAAALEPIQEETPAVEPREEVEPPPSPFLTPDFGKEDPFEILDDVPPPPAPFAHRIVTLRSTSVSSQYDLSSKDILGGGKFGEVHTCMEKQTGLKLAAKVIRKQGAKDKEMVLLEIDVMNQLNHRNLIQLYDAIETPREIILFMEFVEGGELFERIIDDDYHLTEVDCMVFVRQICEGIRFMHHMRVLHLDLKPENILCVTATGHMVKIIDFGLARRYNPQEKLKVNFGTPEFLSPEVVNYEQVSYSTDMWSMGVITYMLLSGLSPFLGDNDTETLNNVLAANWYFDEETFESISDEAKDFVSNLIIKEKSGRMSAGQCLQHPWLNNLAEKAKRCNRRLKSQVLLKKYVMRRRWKKNFIGVCAANRFKKITSSGSLTALGV